MVMVTSTDLREMLRRPGKLDAWILNLKPYGPYRGPEAFLHGGSRTEDRPSSAGGVMTLTTPRLYEDATAEMEILWPGVPGGVPGQSSWGGPVASRQQTTTPGSTPRSSLRSPRSPLGSSHGPAQRRSPRAVSKSPRSEDGCSSARGGPPRGGFDEDDDLSLPPDTKPPTISALEKMISECNSMVKEYLSVAAPTHKPAWKKLSAKEQARAPVGQVFSARERGLNRHLHAGSSKPVGGLTSLTEVGRRSATASSVTGTIVSGAPAGGPKRKQQPVPVPARSIGLAPAGAGLVGGRAGHPFAFYGERGQEESSGSEGEVDTIRFFDDGQRVAVSELGGGRVDDGLAVSELGGRREPRRDHEQSGHHSREGSHTRPLEVVLETMPSSQKAGSGLSFATRKYSPSGQKLRVWVPPGVASPRRSPSPVLPPRPPNRSSSNDRPRSGDPRNEPPTEGGTSGGTLRAQSPSSRPGVVAEALLPTVPSSSSTKTIPGTSTTTVVPVDASLLTENNKLRRDLARMRKSVDGFRFLSDYKTHMLRVLMLAHDRSVRELETARTSLLAEREFVREELARRLRSSVDVVDASGRFLDDAGHFSAVGGDVVGAGPAADADSDYQHDVDRGSFKQPRARRRGERTDPEVLRNARTATSIAKRRAAQEWVAECRRLHKDLTLLEADLARAKSEATAARAERDKLQTDLRVKVELLHRELLRRRTCERCSRDGAVWRTSAGADPAGPFLVESIK